jgi:hypothetical protein
MKNSLYVLLFVMTSVSLTSCELVGDIFKAGVWVGYWQWQQSLD